MRFGIESMSGSGKSFTVDLLMKLLPEDYVYYMELASAKAHANNADEINKYEIIYIPELQKAANTGLTLVESLKNLAEGKDSTRMVWNHQTKNNDVYRIVGNKGLIFTLAIENDYKYDAELGRRFLIFNTDISEEQTQRIIQSKASTRHANAKPNKERFDHLRNHIGYCLNLDTRYENPFSDYIATQVPIEMKSRTQVSYFFDLVEASAKFHINDRIKSNDIVMENL